MLLIQSDLLSWNLYLIIIEMWERKIACKTSRVNDDPLHRPFGGVVFFFLQQQPDLFGIVSQRAAMQRGKWSLEPNW